MKPVPIPPRLPLSFAGWIACGALGFGACADTSDNAASADLAAPTADLASPPPPVFLPPPALGPAGLGVLVNSDDPQSVAVADYYQAARRVPDGNVVRLALGKGLGTSVPAATFAAWKARIDALLPTEVQALAVTWTAPSIVDCMSLTSALAFGFDKKWCRKDGPGCQPSAPSPYFKSESSTPLLSHGLRPAILLAGTSFDDVKKLIDRGVAADGTFPPGDGYLLRTTDEARSVRFLQFQAAEKAWNRPDTLKILYIDNSMKMASDFIQGKADVLFYLTGLVAVPEIGSNRYRPGALADHLTSYGGQVPQSGQMSALRWLEAGATGSFGTVVEPCNFTAKFPDATVLFPRYFLGDTLIEAYWKSVAWPGEGLFIGEPLARPFGTSASFADGTLTVRTTSLTPGRRYALEAAMDPDGPFAPALADVQVPGYQQTTLTLPGATARYYRLSLQ